MDGGFRGFSPFASGFGADAKAPPQFFGGKTERKRDKAGAKGAKNTVPSTPAPSATSFANAPAPPLAPGRGHDVLGSPPLLSVTAPSPSSSNYLSAAASGPFSAGTATKSSPSSASASVMGLAKNIIDAKAAPSSVSTTAKRRASSFDGEVGTKSRKKISRPSLQHKAADSLAGYEHNREFMDKLAESGVDDYVDLPMIAVMGDTSSGKSSLLSNISMVELPSSDTLTTRCPIRLQMRNAKTREACVKVVWKDEPKGDNIDFAERTVGEDNWNDITAIIAEAQAHIIEKSGKEVARDIVCVDMKGPHCENLTLIDLPGIVRSTGKGESETLTEDIQALMHDYLDNERCVILAVHPSNIDFHNSEILAEAKKVDPGTKRTIPVLTKPDLIDEGAESNVKDLLLGDKTDKFEMGFHMVKGRGQKDLNDELGIEDGLTKEEAFFRNKGPWRTIEDRSKFGTKNLRVKLAGLQMRLIHTSFKSIISEMKERRDTAALELKTLGDIPSTIRDKKVLFKNIREQMREGLGAGSLDGRMSQLHSGGTNRPSAEFHLACEKFQNKLNSSKLANITSIDVGSKVIATVGRQEVRAKVCFIDQKGNIYFESEITKNVKLSADWKFSLGTVTESTAGDVYRAKEDGTYDQLNPIPSKQVRCDPDWICDLIQKNRPLNLPIFLNPDLFDAIVADQIEKEWAKPSTKLLKATADLMIIASEKFIDGIKTMKSFPPLREFLIRKSSDTVDSIKQEAETEILKFTEREKTPYTQNHYLFENLSKLRTQHLMEEVLSSVAATRCDSENKVRKDDLTSAIQSVFERNQKKPINHHMAEEMQNALGSYGKVAFKRFVDTVPMICLQTMQRFPKMVDTILSDVTDEEIEQLVVAPPGAIANMIALKKEVETLEKGIDTVNGLSMTVSANFS